MELIVEDAVVLTMADGTGPGRTPEGSWVTGGGYLEYKLREGRHPTRADLDQAVPDRPAVLFLRGLIQAGQKCPGVLWTAPHKCPTVLS